MLGKLLKYEVKATSRSFLPLYGALVVFALINNLLFHLSASRYSSNVFESSSELPSAIGIMVYFSLIVAIFVLTVVVMIQRFYKNLLSDEGYLMFTLPVRTWQLIASKLVVSILWIAASVAVTVLTLFIMAFSFDLFTALPEAFHSLMVFIVRYVGVSEVALFTEAILSMLAGTAEGILMVYASISLGHLFSRHRVLGAFGAFLGLSVVAEIVNSIFRRLCILFTPGGNSPLDFFNYAYNAADLSAFAHIGILLTIFSALFWSVVYFFITSYVLSHKLNLE